MDGLQADRPAVSGLTYKWYRSWGQVSQPALPPGALFDMFERRPLPPWASEFNCANWAQCFLKFIVSHSAVTCAISATSRVDHMRENMGAARGRFPDPETRAHHPLCRKPVPAGARVRSCVAA